jgi:ABC-type Zn uptake system ZnuABC Zn-binding protein ZnuA
VVVTIPPLYSFVKGVGGDKVEVKCLCTTTGVHQFQMDAQLAQLLREADCFLAVGLTLDEHFANKMAQQGGNPKLRYVRLGEQLPEKLLRKLDRPIVHGDHTHEGYDPHVWLGIDQAVALVGLVRDELAAADPDGASAYRANASRYVKTLRKLHADGEKMLEGKENKRIITHHDSLSYFAKSFGLKVAAVIDTTPGDAPTPAYLGTLVNLCLEKSVGAIAIEPQYASRTSADTLRRTLASKGVKVKLITIDPLETADPEELEKEGADWYVGKMRANLKALAKGLP